MFKLNDTVEDKDGAQGTIVYIEDNIVYVELLSGVEMEYRSSDIFPVGTHKEAFDKQVKEHSDKQKSKHTKAYVSGDNPLLEFPAGEILKLYPEMTKVAHTFHDTVNKQLGNPSTWKTATSQQKLNVFASMLSLKVDVFYVALANNQMDALSIIIKARIDQLKQLI